MLEPDRLESLLVAFTDLRIGLVGDLFLDRYLEIDVTGRELSIETGLEAYQVDRIRNHPGALGTVMSNLAALGVGSLIPITRIGKDGHGFDLKQALQHLSVDTRHLHESRELPTPAYTKPLVRSGDSWRELNRLDIRPRRRPEDAEIQQIVDSIQACRERVDAWVVLDQVEEPHWGVVGSAAREALAGIASTEDSVVPLVIDSRRHLHEFPFGSLKGNLDEVTDAVTRLGGSTCREAARAVEFLAERTGRTAFGTAGADGIWFCDPGGAAERSPGLRIAGPVDPVGAGDSVTAALVAALAAGATPREAAGLANLVASITVRQLGTTGTASPEALRRALPPSGDGSDQRRSPPTAS